MSYAVKGVRALAERNVVPTEDLYALEDYAADVARLARALAERS